MELVWKLSFAALGLVLAALFAFLLYALIKTGLRELDAGNGGYGYLAAAGVIVFGLYKFARSMFSATAQDKRDAEAATIALAENAKTLDVFRSHGLINQAEYDDLYGALQKGKAKTASLNWVAHALLAQSKHDDELKLDATYSGLYAITGDRDYVAPVTDKRVLSASKGHGVRVHHIPRMIDAFADFSEGRFKPTNVINDPETGLSLELEGHPVVQPSSQPGFGNLDMGLVITVIGLFHARVPDKTIYARMDGPVRLFAALSDDEAKALNRDLGEDIFRPLMEERMELRRDGEN